MEEKQQSFVIVDSRQAAEAAVERLDGLELNGSRLRVRHWIGKGYICSDTHQSAVDQDTPRYVIPPSLASTTG
jgi:RNA recognition motif-containing protein